MKTLPMVMQAACLPGLSIAVVEDGRVVSTKSLGVANVLTGQAVHDDALFQAASMSKPVFAYTVLQLADQKRIDIDAPLVRYLKPDYLPNDPDIELITTRHVLTHSSGLPNWGGQDNQPESFKLAFTPGRYFRYSGEGFLWLQLVVEHLTGKSLHDFVHSVLFEPAGMQNSYFYCDSEIAQRTVSGHQGGVLAPRQHDFLDTITQLEQEWGKSSRHWMQADWTKATGSVNPDYKVTKRLRFWNAMSASSLLTTASDYGRFLSLIMNRPQRATWEISEATRLDMIRPQKAVVLGAPHWWGLGLEIEHSAAGWRIGHEGNNGGRFTSYSGLDPERRRGLVVLTNDGSGFGVYQRIVRNCTGLDQLSFVACNSPPHGPRTEKITFSFEGKTLSGFLDLPVAREASALVLIVPGDGRTNFGESNEFYDPLIHNFTSRGFACFRWDKAGCGNSEGPYRSNQTVQSSANEVLAAIDALKRRGVPGSSKVGLWGISRAGWICPLAIQKSREIVFWISVSGADDKENFAYLLRTNLRIEGRSEAQTNQLVSAWQAGNDVFRKGGSFQEFQKARRILNQDAFWLSVGSRQFASQEDYLTSQRDFMGQHPEFDEKTGLRIYVPKFSEVLRAVDCPVLAIFGEKDTRIDWRKTRDLYRETIGKSPNSSLTIKTFAEGNHNIQRCKTGGIREVNPTSQMCDGYFDAISLWLKEHGLTSY